LYQSLSKTQGRGAEAVGLFIKCQRTTAGVIIRVVDALSKKDEK